MTGQQGDQAQGGANSGQAVVNGAAVPGGAGGVGGGAGVSSTTPGVSGVGGTQAAQPGAGGSGAGAQPSPSSPEPAAGAGAAAGQAAAQAGWRELMREYGVDLSQYGDDRAAAAQVALQWRQAQQANQLAQYGQQYLQHREVIEAALKDYQARQQQQQAQQKKWFSLPEYDPRWGQMVQQDPATGQYAVKPGYPPDVLQKLTSYAASLQDLQTKFWQDPETVLGPMVQHIGRGSSTRRSTSTSGSEQELNILRNRKLLALMKSAAASRSTTPATSWTGRSVQARPHAGLRRLRHPDLLPARPLEDGPARLARLRQPPTAMTKLERLKNKNTEAIVKVYSRSPRTS
jgi:hypothetical protein